jgi:hypothetical protein
MGDWTPAEIIEMGRLVIEGLFVLVGLIGIFTTKSHVKGMRKDVDGRFSQMMDLIARLSGAPEQRSAGNPRAADREPAPPAAK